MKKIFFILLFFFFAISKTTYSQNNIQEPTKYIIYIDVNNLTLSLINKSTNEPVKIYPVAIGSLSTPSPIGTWQVVNKAIKEESAFGGYWLGLNAPWDTFGIHGTSRPDSIGQMKSNGCIRLNNYNIKELFYLVEPGTSVIIDGGPSWLFSPYARNIKPNDRGCDVYHLQRRLKDLRYYFGEVNGIYEYTLELAVLKYRCDYCLPGTSEVDRVFLDSIGLPKFE